MKRIACLLILLGALCGPVTHAQRTAAGVPFSTLSAMPLPHSPAASLSAGAYTLHGYWEASLRGDLHPAALSTGEALLRYGRFTAGASYMVRLAATDRRTVNLYAGAGIFAGYEVADLFRAMPPEVETPLKEGAYVFGAAPTAEAEFYLFPGLALTLSGQLPVTFLTQFRTLSGAFSVGVRWLWI